MDYVNEGRNIERFRENFKDDPDIIIPKVFWQYSTKNVLVMEEIVGKRIDRSLPKTRKARTDLMDKVANMVFKQIFEFGIFHADPHPGNIFLTADGKIALLDFGIIGVFDEDLQISITDLFIAMIERDLKGMTHAMIKLGMVDSDTIDERLLQADLREYLGKYYGTELEVIKIGEVFSRLITISRKHNMVLPANFVLFGKALVTLEGLGEHIDPHWNFVECAQPYVKDLIKRRKGPRSIIHRTRRSIEKLKFFFEGFPDQANELMRDVKKADHYIELVHEDIESLTTEMNRSANRLVLGILMSGCIMGGALLVGATDIKLFGLPIFPVLGFGAAMFLGLILMGSIAHEKRYQ
jgi:ubiquinone biosynthesis protein